MASLDARLRRLESEDKRQPIRFRVVWPDNDEAPTAGPVIRLRWPDDREQGEA